MFFGRKCNIMPTWYKADLPYHTWTVSTDYSVGVVRQLGGHGDFTIAEINGRFGRHGKPNPTELPPSLFLRRCRHPKNAISARQAGLKISGGTPKDKRAKTWESCHLALQPSHCSSLSFTTDVLYLQGANMNA